MSRRLLRIGILLAALAPAPAVAQASASVVWVSDYRFRGHSMTNGDPALSVEIGLDDPSGFYFGANATGAVVKSSPKFVNFSENVGYAHRLNSGVTVDLGVVRSDYTEYFSGGRPAHLTEIYAGFQHKAVAAYLRYSPDYLRPDRQTLYGEIDVTAEPADAWRLTAHAGLLAEIAGPPRARHGRTSYDWKLGVIRQLGHFELGLAVSGGGPGRDYYQGYGHDRTAVVASLGWRL